MTVEVAAHNENIPLSNGNVPITTEAPAKAAGENIFVTIILTIYDVIVFLSISIGYICQVS